MPPRRLIRRRVLQTAGSALAVSFAGCAVMDEGSDPGNSPTPSPTSSETATPTPVSTAELTLDVTLLQQFTTAHPARIKIALENTGERTVTMRGGSGGPVFPFAGFHGWPSDGGETPKLLLIPDDSEYVGPASGDEPLIPSEPTDSCWSVDYELSVDPIGLVGDIPPGTAQTMDYTVLDHGNDTCLPPGGYVFTDNQDLAPGGLEQTNQDASYSELTLAVQLTIDENGAVSEASGVVRDYEAR